MKTLQELSLDDLYTLEGYFVRQEEISLILMATSKGNKEIRDTISETIKALNGKVLTIKWEIMKRKRELAL